MAIAIGAILALLGIAVAIYPFLRHRFFVPAEAEGEDGGNSEDALIPGDGLADDLESIYDAIRTLQLERELGNIPEGLYREQLNGYRRQAALLLREREQERRAEPGDDDGNGNDGNDGDWALEEEIKVARAGLYRPQDGGVPCANCGRPVPAGADSCVECGVAVGPMPEREREAPATDGGGSSAP